MPEFEDLSAKTSGQQRPEDGEGRHGSEDGTGLSPATAAPVPADDHQRTSGGDDNDVNGDPGQRGPDADPADALTLPELLEVLEDIAVAQQLEDDDDGDWEVKA